MAYNRSKTARRASPAKPVAKPVVAAPVAAPITEPVAAKPVVPAAPVAAKIAQPAAAAPAPTKPVAEKIVETTAALAPAIKKEVTTMETTINSAADKTQAMFTDAQDRAKTTWEKSQKFAAEMTDFSKGNVEALVESGKIAAKGVESMGQSAAEYGRKQFEAATAAMKSMSGIKSPTDFFQLHSEYVRTSFDSIVAETSKNTEAMLKLAGEIAQPIQNRVAVAVEKVKVAA